MENTNLNMVNEMINDTGDDRSNIQPQDNLILIVEDDLRFAKILIEKAHIPDLKAIVATNYLEVFDFINRHIPIAITLDVKLPDTSGWKVLDLLRNDFNYRHIPIHLISGEENRILALQRGARSFHLKPLDNKNLDQLYEDFVQFSQKRIKKILLVEDNELDSSQIVKILETDQVHVTLATDGSKAMETLQNELI